MNPLPYLSHAVLAQIEPSTIQALLSMGPTGIAALAIAAAIWLFLDARAQREKQAAEVSKLHGEHVELLKQVLPVAQKLSESVERLERRLDRLETQPSK